MESKPTGGMQAKKNPELAATADNLICPSEDIRRTYLAWWNRIPPFIALSQGCSVGSGSERTPGPLRSRQAEGGEDGQSCHPPWVSHGGPETEFFDLCWGPEHTAVVTKGKKAKGKAGSGTGISDGLLRATWQPSSSYSCSVATEPW